MVDGNEEPDLNARIQSGMQQPNPARNAGAPWGELSPVWQLCLQQAWEAYTHGSLPIGAVIADHRGEVLAVGRNRLSESGEHAPHVAGTPYIEGSPLAHAEVNALLQLGHRRTQPRAVLYTTTEPCPLCMGASRMVGIGKVVYASRDAWAGAALMADSVPYIRQMGPSVEGPISSLEEPLMTWLLAAHGDQQLRTGAFIDRWRDDFPRAAQVGLRLNTTGALRAVAAGGASAVWAALHDELAAG